MGGAAEGADGTREDQPSADHPGPGPGLRPYRIAAHNGAPVWGGAEIATARLLAGLDARGHAVRLYCNDPEVKRRAAAMGILTRRLHLGGDIAVHHALRFARELRRTRPDVLLLSTFRKLWLGALAARLAGVPRVVARIGLETDMPRNAKYRWVFRNWIDAVAFNADGMRERFLEVMPEYDGETATIYTGIRPPGPRDGIASRAMLGVPLGARVIGSVGRLARQKRYDRVVGLLAAIPDLHALIVGEGSERGLLERTAADAGVAHRLHLPGHLDEVGPALDAMDLFVLTSDREGMSNAMLEALAAGVPVVSTDVSGAREALAPPSARPGADRPDAVEDGADPVPPGVVVGFDADELTAAVRGLLADRTRLRTMGEAAREVARERFGVDRMLTEWERVLGTERRATG